MIIATWIIVVFQGSARQYTIDCDAFEHVSPRQGPRPRPDRLPYWHSIALYPVTRSSHLLLFSL